MAMERDTFRFSDWLVSANGLERSRVKYGMSWLKGNKLPYFSITLEREERRNLQSNYWEYSGGGAALEEIAEKFPALAGLVKWHLCDQDGTPMHYIANATFWYEIATHARERGPYDKDPIGSFKAVVVYGAIPEDDQEEIKLTFKPRELRDILEGRLPLLQAAFKREMAAADVTFILPAEMAS